MTDKSKSLVVIGAGSGGFNAAIHAADRGLDVTLVDPAINPGGERCYHGEIPLKMLYNIATTIADASASEDSGITFGKPSIDLDKLRARKDQVIQEQAEALGKLARKHHVKFIRGRVRFTSSHSLIIEHADGSSEEREFENAIIATGSTPMSFASLKTHSPLVMDSRDALKLVDVPERLLIVGGGCTGLELGYIYSALGSQVTLIEKTNELLSGADRDLVRVLMPCLKRRFEGVWLNTSLTRLQVQKNGVKVILEGKGAEYSRKVFDKAIVAIGRVPNIIGLGLKKTKVQIDTNDFIIVDRQRLTHDPKIWAIGDVVGEPMLSQRASYEGRVAAEAIAGRMAAFEPRAIPQVVFGDPEIAWAGLTETQAILQNRNFRTISRSMASDCNLNGAKGQIGMSKIIIDPDSRLILGVGIVCRGASEIISEGTMAIEMAATIDDLYQVMHTGASLTNGLSEGANMKF